MRKAGLLLGMVLLFGLTAAAQETTPKAEAFFGYSYVRGRPATSNAPNVNLHGGSTSLAFNPTGTFGIVGDFGGYHVGSVNGVNVDSNLYTYLFGPRLSYRRKVTPYVQALFGGAHLTGSALGLSGSSNSFAMALGGGLDVHATNHLAIRLGQAEYLLTRFPEVGPRVTQNNLRISSGVVFRW